MSINFNDPMNEDARSMIDEVFKDEIQAKDDKTVLLKKIELNQRLMSELANKAKQPVSVEINKIGETKTVGGVDYVVSEQGWRKKDKP